MGVGELLLGLVIGMAGLLASSVAVAAARRTGDVRLLSVAGAGLGLLAVGALGAYGNLAANPPAYAVIPEIPLAILAVVAGLLLLPSLLPRSR